MDKINKVVKCEEVYKLITDDWEDEILQDVDDHGTKNVTYIYHVDDAFIKDYPMLLPYKGYWGRNLEFHPYDGEIYGDDFITRYERKEVISFEWVEVDND